MIKEDVIERDQVGDPGREIGGADDNPCGCLRDGAVGKLDRRCDGAVRDVVVPMFIVGEVADVEVEPGLRRI